MLSLLLSECSLFLLGVCVYHLCVTRLIAPNQIKRSYNEETIHYTCYFFHSKELKGIIPRFDDPALGTCVFSLGSWGNGSRKTEARTSDHD